MTTYEIIGPHSYDHTPDRVTLTIKTGGRILPPPGAPGEGHAMRTKQLEIRDVATTVPALAIQVSGADGYLMRRAGFGDVPMVYLIALATQKANYDPYAWGNRTLKVAHIYIEAHFETLTDGQVIDVEYILGESAAPKRSEQETRPL